LILRLELPVITVLRKILLALVAGNPVVLKPSTKAVYVK
jgi:acyl-CoA reductase-like NAD-dependent aldehyde dehydrogenase